MALKTRPDQFRRRSRPACAPRSWLARRRLVSRLTGYPVQYNKAVVGRNAFAHESGIHQHGVLEDRATYEIIDAATGRARTAAQIVLGKHSGRHAFADTLEKMGMPLQGDALNAGVRPVQGACRPQGAADRGRPRGDRRRGARHGRWRTGFALAVPRRARAAPIGDAARHGRAQPTATQVEAAAEGNGMIDAACKAISQATGVEARLVGLQGLVGHRRRRRARRRRHPARGRRPRGLGPWARPPTSSKRRPGPTSRPRTESSARRRGSPPRVLTPLGETR